MAKAVDWNNVPSLTAGMKNLGNQFNRRWPSRDGASDGAWGDEAHTKHKSGHNRDDTKFDNAEWDGDPDNIPEIRAIDVDNNLNESGVTFQMVIDHMRKLPGLASVIRYMIYNGKIYNAPDFEGKTYTGASPHTEHGHFSGAYTQASDNNTKFDFKFDQVGDTMSVAEVVDGNEEYNKVTKQAGTTYNQNTGGRNVWDWQDIPNPILNKKGPAWQAVQSIANQTLAISKALASIAEKVDLDPAELAAIKATLVVPTAEENAEAVVEALGGVDMATLNLTLRNVLTDDQREELASLLIS